MNENHTVLFADKHSIYKKIGCNVYDLERNALTYKDKKPCIYHPPCRTWSRLRGLAKNHPGEHLLAVWSVLRIWRYSGVLEHPAQSTLWKTMNLPKPGSPPDIYGGFSISVNQFWFGHKAEKNTWLYIKGITINEVPVIPLNFDAITHTISSSKNKNGKKEISKNKRSSTPIKFAYFLIEIICNIKTAAIVSRIKNNI